MLELGEHHRAESDDGAVGGGEDAGVRPTRYQAALQGVEGPDGGRSRYVLLVRVFRRLC